MAKLTTKQRNALPNSAFAGPDRSYPVEDKNHARAALSRVSQYGTPAEKSRVRAKVKKRYPGMGGARAEVMRKRSDNDGSER